MSEKLSLNLDDLNVESFEPTAAIAGGTQYIIAQPADSWPAICTCIGICAPSADIYCTGGCGPFVAQPVAVKPAAY